MAFVLNFRAIRLAPCLRHVIILNMSRHKQKVLAENGSSVVLIILLVVFAGMAVFAGVRVFSENDTNQKKPDTVQNDSTQRAESQLPQTKTYEDKKWGFKIKILNEWTITNNDTDIDDQRFIFGARITEGGKHVANIYTVTGKGGGCEPSPTDIPFAASGNQCPTQEFIKSIPADDGGVVLRSRIQDVDGMNQYGYCYRPSKVASPQLNTPRMGFVLNCGPEDLFIRIEADGDSDINVYENATVKQLEKALATVSFSG